jgi:hypothetical protein
MNMTDYGPLLNTSYRGWKEYHDAYLDLATQVAAGVEIPRSDVDAAREDADRALSDFMSIDEQAPGQTRESDAQAVR